MMGLMLKSCLTIPKCVLTSTLRSNVGVALIGTLPDINGIINTHRVSSETKQILNSPNAGGGSINSEAYAMEVLHRHFNARSVTTEMDIKYYNPGWKKCDFITRMSERVGVSVTRALTDKKSNPDTLDVALDRLLVKKLTGLVVSRAGVDPNQSFYKSLLFVWSPDAVSSNIFRSLFQQISESNPLLTQDVNLILVETDEDHLRTDFKQLKSIPYRIRR